MQNLWAFSRTKISYRSTPVIDAALLDISWQMLGKWWAQSAVILHTAALALICRHLSIMYYKNILVFYTDGNIVRL